MGFYFWNNISPASREGREEKRIDRKTPSWPLSWLLVLFLAFLFFLSSIIPDFFKHFFSISRLPWLVFFLAFLLLIFELREQKLRKYQKKKREEMVVKFKEQKKELQNLFDLRKNAFKKAQKEENELKIKSSSNFADLPLEEKEIITEEKPEEITVSESITPALKKEKNKKDLFVEGENIKNFPENWQKFFLENENQDPAKKLQKMLEE